MGRKEDLARSLQGLNARDFASAFDGFAEDVKLHAPGIPLDVEGRDAVAKSISEFVEGTNANYTAEDIIEHGPFAVVFARCVGTVGGQQMTWDLCEVVRYEEDEAAEVWVVRGGAPKPLSS